MKLLGPFGLFNDDGRNVRISSRKGQALLAMLATGNQGRRSRVWLQDRLWGSRPLDKAQVSLRRELFNIRKQMKHFGVSGLVTADATEVTLCLDRIQVDYLKILKGQWENTLKLANEFLEGIDIPEEEGFEDWLRTHRNRYEEIWDAHDIEPKRSDGDAVLLSGSANSFKTRVAVLPFSHWTDSEHGGDIADCLVEEISHTLSRYATLQVIDAATSLGLGDQQDETEFIKNAGLHYFVSGNLRQLRDELKITIGLTDSRTKIKIWSGKFKGQTSSFFHLLDEISQALVPEIDGNIDRNERKHAVQMRVETPDAYILYWKASAAFRKWTPDSIEQAIYLTDKIFALEPKNAWAKSLNAFCHAVSYNFGWSADPQKSRKSALNAYRAAISDEPAEAIVLGYAAGTLTMLGEDIDAAHALITRAMELEYPSSGIFFWSGWIDLARQDFLSAEKKFERCFELNPGSAVRPFMLTGLSIARLVRFETGQVDENMTEALQMLPEQPVVLAAAAASKAMIGEVKAAQKLAGRFFNNDGMRVISPLLKNSDQRALFEKLLSQVRNGMLPSMGHEANLQ